MREHPAHERQSVAAFLAGASIRLGGGLFLRDARAVMPDDEADEGRLDLSAAPEWSERFVQSVGVLDDVGENFVAADEELEQGVVRDAGEAAPLLKEGTRRANALGRAEISELARRGRCAVFNKQ